MTLQLKQPVTATTLVITQDGSRRSADDPFLFHVVFVDFEVSFDMSLSRDRCALEWIKHPDTRGQPCDWRKIKITADTALAYLILQGPEHWSKFQSLFGCSFNEARRRCQAHWDTYGELASS